MRPVCGKKEELSDDTRSIGERERMNRKVVRKLNFVADGFRIYTQRLREKYYIYAHTVGVVLEENS